MTTLADILPPWTNINDAPNAMCEAYIRRWRNQELLASDWTQLPDADTHKVDVAAWRVYRQELRDMMTQNADPKLIVFPTPPE